MENQIAILEAQMAHLYRLVRRQERTIDRLIHALLLEAGQNAQG
jgi:hypothetical protein